MTKTWQEKTVEATRDTMFGAIVAEALELAKEFPAGYTRSDNQRYVGTASIMSDGFLICSYVDAHGNYHSGAFIGSVEDLEQNIVRFPQHIRMTLEERKAFYRIMRKWISLDYRGKGLVLDDGGKA
jgi:hypothetical protein